jgi:hypothetical protein
MPPDPSVPSSSQPAWAALATAIAGAIAVLAKKSFTRRAARPSTINYQPSTMLVTQQQLDAMRDRVTAGYMAMAEKFDSHQKEILAAIGTQGTAIEKRLDALESAVARLDERTRK